MKKNTLRSNLGASVILACGLAITGSIMALGIIKAKQSDRYVAVKGLAERPVSANQGTWKISFDSFGDNLEKAIMQNSNDRKQVLDYLMQSGIKKQDIRPGMPRVQDRSNYQTAKISFAVSDSVVIVSKEVGTIQDVARNSGELLTRGVALSGWDNPQYFFTNLSSIKPKMIEEATQDARKAAEKFAQDSQSKVGSIRHASQGYFSFKGESSGVPEREQIQKIARVVISVDYLISD
ncbi:MAG: SIMPL domain-containing protein [Oligoflexales bacterium]